MIKSNKIILMAGGVTLVLLAVVFTSLVFLKKSKNNKLLLKDDVTIQASEINSKIESNTSSETIDEKQTRVTAIFSGTIGNEGKSSEIVLVMNESIDNNISGYYYYKNFNIPIRISGLKKGKESVELFALDRQGKQVEEFVGITNQYDAFSGTWKNLVAKKEQPFSLYLLGGGGIVKKDFVSKNSKVIATINDNYEVALSTEPCSVGDFSGSVYGEVLIKNNKSGMVERLVSDDMGCPNFNSDFTTEQENYDFWEDYVDIDDYNFDGKDDIAVLTGNDGSYGANTYDIYLFDSNKKEFVLNPSATDLFSVSLTAEVVSKEKFIEAMNKSGCCWHETTRYKWEGDFLVAKERITSEIKVDKYLVEKEVEEIITEEKMSNGKWIVVSKEIQIVNPT